jgi:hypothetical protein
MQYGKPAAGGWRGDRSGERARPRVQFSDVPPGKPVRRDAEPDTRGRVYSPDALNARTLQGNRVAYETWPSSDFADNSVTS